MSYARTANRFTTEAIEKSAERQGVDVIWSDDHTLLLDLDGDDSINVFWRQWDMLIDTHPDPYNFSEPRILPSRGGHGYHAIIRVEAPLNNHQRILLQAILGSDVKRELLSYVGLLHGQDNPTVLFRPKGEVL